MEPCLTLDLISIWSFTGYHYGLGGSQWTSTMVLGISVFPKKEYGASRAKELGKASPLRQSLG